MKNNKKPPQSLIKLKNFLDSKYFTAFDYIAALAIIGYGLYCESNFMVVIGIAGLALAYIKPAKRLESAIIRKKQ